MTTAPPGLRSARSGPALERLTARLAADPLPYAAAFAQALFGMIFMVAVGWHQPSLVGSPPVAVIIAGVATFAGVLVTVRVAERIGGRDLAALVVTVDFLALVGALVRFRMLGGSVSDPGLVLAGLALMVVLARYAHLLRWSRPLGLMLVGVALIGGIWLARSRSVNGAQIVVTVGRLNFQLAEIIIACLLGLVAANFRRRKNLIAIRHIGRVGIPSGPAMIRIAWPAALGMLVFGMVKDLGPAFLLVTGVCGILVYRTREYFYAVIFAAVAGLGLLALPQLPQWVTRGKFSYVDHRLHEWLHPFGAGSPQTGKALLSLARGGVVGAGPGADRARSIGDEYVNDYVLSSIGEQLGAVGLLLVLATAGIMIWQLGRFARSCPDGFQQTWAVGLTVMIAAHVALPAMTAGRLAPVVGVTSVLLSAGGSSMLATFIVIGLVAGVGLERPVRTMPVKGAVRSAPAGAARQRAAPNAGAARLPGSRALAGGLALLLASGLVLVQVVGRGALLAHDADGDVRWIANATPQRGQLLASDGRTVLATSATVEQVGQTVDGRRYPTGAAAAAVTGYLVPRKDLSSGVEGAWARTLECGPATSGARAAALGARCQAADLRLTLDARVQWAAGAALAGRHGAVVAMDPSSGALLAVTSSPGYDPNTVTSPGSDDPVTVATALRAVDSSWRGRQTTYRTDQRRPGETVPDLHPATLKAIVAGEESAATQLATAPGSVFKLVVAATGTPEELARPVPVLNGLRYHDDDRTLDNALGIPCGGSLREIIKVSCNTGFAQLGRRFGPKRIADTARRFGFDQPLTVDGVPVGSSYVPDPATPDARCGATDVELTAIGEQCVRATPLQMATVVATIANGGSRPVPYLVDRVERQGRTVQTPARGPATVVTSPQVASMITAGMVATVAEAGGTAASVAIPGVGVAAKTGSAQAPCNAGQTMFSTNAWMVAFAPATHPKVAVAVFLEAPPCASLIGGVDAGPVARSVITAALGR